MPTPRAKWPNEIGREYSLLRDYAEKLESLLTMVYDYALLPPRNVHLLRGMLPFVERQARRIKLGQMQ